MENMPFNPADWGFALALLLTILTMLIFDKGLVTKTRLSEWRDIAERERKAREQSDAALRDNTRQLERMADLLEIRNTRVRRDTRDIV